jgi:hypothetical protein
MATSHYDVNVQLALATTAEHEGDLDAALRFLAEAHRTARDHREVHAQVHWYTARFHARHRTGLPLMKHVALSLLAAVL